MAGRALLLALGTALLAACGSADDPTTTATDPAFAGINPDPPAMTAKVFADTAAASDLFEIESSRLAQAEASSPAARSFAAMMIADHGKSTEQLKAAAAEAGVSLEIALTSGQEADLTDLKAAGDRFDTVYAEKQLVAHANALAGLRKYAAAGDSAQLRAFAAGAFPVVEHHIAEANKLLR